MNIYVWYSGCSRKSCSSRSVSVTLDEVFVVGCPSYCILIALVGYEAFTVLRSLGRQSERLANDYITYVSTGRRIQQQPGFNHCCKDHGLVPAGLKLKSPLNTQEAIQIVKPPADDWSKRA